MNTFCENSVRLTNIQESVETVVIRSQQQQLRSMDRTIIVMKLHHPPLEYFTNLKTSQLAELQFQIRFWTFAFKGGQLRIFPSGCPAMEIC